MKKLIVLTLVLFFTSWLHAQEIIVRHNDKGMYIVHTVTPKETFYSLGRSFNVPPKEIAAFNSLEMERGLGIGQTVNIPLSVANFSQSSQKGQPVYYVVGEKEGLYRVSLNNGKVLMANLRKWNGLNTDVISPGQKLIVGYISSQEGAIATNKNVVAEKKEEVKPQEEKPAVLPKEEKPAEKKEPVVERKIEEPKMVSTAVNDGNGGYFKTSFDQQIKAQPIKKDETAAAGIFKTASGWQDAKYYALIDGVEPGTIIRVINPTNNKAIYAKVLDKMTGIRQNQGYNLRISNASATALDIADTEKFFVRINY
ncbi:MAG: LysM peptidoglycan-binding domain-containing protein [Bacteroidota bacterium]|nr:LysM peptidoglycan-binding domain-containing protein [Bacteroidota bacterium]